MSQGESDLSALSHLVGCWNGTFLHRTHVDHPFQSLEGTSENRWVLGGRFVEMTLRAGTSGDTWSAVFYVGYERNERRHVLVSLEPGDSRVTTRLGEWRFENSRLLLTSHQSRAVCDMSVPGQLKLALVEETVPGREFVRFRADFRPAVVPAIARPALPRDHRRFVIA
jgi:hypothetical protein